MEQKDGALTGTARVIVPTGMLGAGFTGTAVQQGIAMGADAIAIDGGSTDSGPYYLGASTPKTTAQAVAHDLRIALPAAMEAGIPLIIGSCGTSGTDAGVDWVCEILAEVAAKAGLEPRVARIYSEQDPEEVSRRLAAGLTRPLPPADELDEATIRRCEHIVGLLGHEPIVDALERGADVVLTGRATDTAVLAAVPLMLGCPPGPTWHAAKTAECGGQCTAHPSMGGVIFEVDRNGFTIEPLHPDNHCTPTSVAAHMLYENADPFRLSEPAGTLDTTQAVYTAVDERRVRVDGSRFEEAANLTMKLEGSAIAGFQSMALVGIRDPDVLAEIDDWLRELANFLRRRSAKVLELDPADFHIELRCYGHNAVLGDLEPTPAPPPREVGVLMLATAASQETASAITKLANPYLLHMPRPWMEDLPSFAFAGSPAETPRGPVFEFLLQHVVVLDHPLDLCRIEIDNHG